MPAKEPYTPKCESKYYAKILARQFPPWVGPDSPKTLETKKNFSATATYDAPYKAKCSIVVLINLRSIQLDSEPISKILLICSQLMTTLPLPEVLTTEENAKGGIAVVTLPGFGPENAPTRRGFFFDNSVDRGRVLEQFIGWFTLWGIPVKRLRGTETAFERSFFTLEWPKEQIQNAHGPQTVKVIAGHIDEFVKVMQERQPRLVIFLSCYLWQAVNLSEIRPLLEPVFGQALDTGRRITDKRLSAFIQHWQNCTMLALPQPSKNTTETIVRSFSSQVQVALNDIRLLPQTTFDPLLETAGRYLIVDAEQSIRCIAVHLHVDQARAQKLFQALEGKMYVKEINGKLKIKL